MNLGGRFASAASVLFRGYEAAATNGRWPVPATMREPADGNIKAASAVGLWPIGTAVKAAGTSDATVQVQLDGVAVVAVGA
jgi:hypothetical protein